MAERAIAARMRAKGAEYLDAPVSGGEIGAIEGTLTIMVGLRNQPQYLYGELKQWHRTSRSSFSNQAAIKSCSRVMISGGTQALGDALEKAQDTKTLK